jgi:hypothetical protein
MEELNKNSEENKTSKSSLKKPIIWTLFIFTIIFLFILITENSGSNSLDENDLTEIELQKESIIHNWDALLEKYTDMKDEDFTQSLEYDLINDKTYSQYKEVSSMAKSYLDSIKSLNVKVLDGAYGMFFQYAKSQGWDKINKDEIRKVENSYKTKQDEFSSSKLFRHPTSPKYVNYDGFFLYYVKNDNEIPNVYLRTQYSSDDWLFIKSAQISIDGDVYSLDIDEWERDNSDGEIFEWGTEHVKYFNLLTHILNGNRIKIRYEGDLYHDDRVLTITQKQAIKDVLRVYYVLYLKDKINLDK